MSRQARLGLLVTTGTALFVLMLFLLARRSFLFGEVIPVNADFSFVAGLETGAEVRYRGIAVGTVEEVALPQNPGDLIRVRMAIQREAGHLIRADCQAQIKSDGVLGNQLLVLTGGSEDAPPVEEGGIVEGVDPMELMGIADQALSSVAVFDSVVFAMTRVLGKIERGEGTIGRLFQDPELYERSLRTTNRAQNALTDVTATIDSVGARITATLKGLDSVIGKVDSGEGTLARLVNESELHDEVLATSRRLDSLIVEMDSLVTEIGFASEWGTVALYRAAVNMEALQHHWLFRRYFKNHEAGAVFSADSLLQSQRERR